MPLCFFIRRGREELDNPTHIFCPSRVSKNCAFRRGCTPVAPRFLFHPLSSLAGDVEAVAHDAIRNLQGRHLVFLLLIVVLICLHTPKLLLQNLF